MATRTAPPIRETGYAVSQKQGGHAGFLDYAGVAIDSLRANKLRSFLTLLGIIIGTGAGAVPAPSAGTDASARGTSNR